MARITHAPEMHRGADGGALNADDIPVTDIAGNFTATEVEAILAELAAAVAAVAGGTTYTHDQAVAAATWTVAHGLGRYPSVTVVDSAGTMVFGEVNYLDANTVQLDFSTAFSGKAYLN